MALLRPCSELVKVYGKSFLTCQIVYNRSFARIAPRQSYVTSAPKLDRLTANIEKSEINNTGNNVLVAEQTPTGTIYWQLLQLCRIAKNREIRDQDLLRIIETDENPENNNISRESIGLSLLRCSGDILPNVKPSDRRNLTQRIWNLIEEKLSPPTLRHYNLLLTVYARNSQTVDPKKFLKSMKVPADAETHQLLLNCVAKSGDVESALYVLSLMKQIGCSLNETIFNSLIEAYATSGDIESALRNFQTMRDARIEPSSTTWTIVACAYASVGDIDDTMKILNSQKLTLEQTMKIAKCLSLTGNGELIIQVLKFLPTSENFYNSTIVDDTCELTYAGKARDAYTIVDALTSDDPSDERDAFYANYLGNLVKAETPIDVLLKIMNRLEKMKKYSAAIMDVCEAALCRGERELALSLFEIIHERAMIVRPHYYWPVLLRASRNEGEAEIFRTIKHMLSLDVRLDHDTLYYYVLPHVNTIDIACIARKFVDIGLDTSIFVTPLICHSLMRGNLEDSISLCSRYKSTIDFSKILYPLSVAFKIDRRIDRCVEFFKYAPTGRYHAGEFLRILYGASPRDRDAPIVEKFLRAFNALEIPVASFQDSSENEKTTTMTTTTTTTTKTMINSMDNWVPTDKIPHPRDMSIDELECHLIELRSKQMNKRGVLRRLLMLHCPQNNLTRVNEIKKEYDENGYLWTSGMYSSLLQLYIRNGKIDEARDLYKELREHHTDFKIDDLKIVQFATALVEAKRIDEAIAIIDSGRSKGGPLLSRECWRLLNTVAHSEYYEMTERILDILVNAGYCERTNMILGPLVRRHLLKDDLPGAIDSFKKFAKQYRCTPLRQELINALLRSMKINDKTRDESIKLLEDVQNINNKIHGAGGTNVDLFLGFARNGMRQELQNFLKKNRVSDQLLAKSLDQITERDKQSLLTELVETCASIPNSQRILIYEQLLSVYSKTGDCERAIELWRKMSKERGTTSRIFITNFVNLLEKHNVQLPEDFEAT